MNTTPPITPPGGPLRESPGPAARFCVRIVSLDYYMCRPLPGVDVCYSEFAGAEVESVPVVRVFGPTPGGQAACLHVHKVKEGGSGVFAWSLHASSD